MDHHGYGVCIVLTPSGAADREDWSLFGLGNGEKCKVIKGGRVDLESQAAKRKKPAQRAG
ncbi:hypothetical protein [Burkholderia ubonensis]|uniref:hypothetical protein n=1 Tax=Burkholderia ubonensis TaxID=101571 RepID=UPI000AF85F75|nr:hypothetical protein [Burkholderia ubonensis]